MKPPKIVVGISLCFLCGCGVMRAPTHNTISANGAENVSADTTNVSSAGGLVAVTASVSKLAEELSGIKAEIKEVKASLNVQTTATVGWRNDVKLLSEKIDASAGRDVNMLPQTAVDAMLGVNDRWAKTLIAAISVLCGLTSTVIVLSARNSRKRAETRYNMEREERQALLKAALRNLPEDPKPRAIA